MEKHILNPGKVRSLLLEIELNNLPAVGQTEYKLSTNASLREAVGILSIEAFNASLVSKSPTGKTNMPDAAYKATFVSLFNSNDVEVRAKMPLASFIRSNGNSRIEPLNLVGTKDNQRPIDPEKSKILIGDCSLAFAGQVALILVTYVAP